MLKPPHFADLSKFGQPQVEVHDPVVERSASSSKVRLTTLSGDKATEEPNWREEGVIGRCSRATFSSLIEG